MSNEENIKTEPYVFVVSETGNEEDNFLVADNQYALQNIKTILTHYHTTNLGTIRKSLDAPYFRSIQDKIEGIIIDVEQVINEISTVEDIQQLNGLKTINDEIITVKRKKLHGVWYG